MSFEIRITGHTPQNDEASKVKDVAVAATRALLTLGGSASLSGYASDPTNSFTFSDQDVADAIALEQRINEPAPEPEAAAAPEETSGQEPVPTEPTEDGTQSGPEPAPAEPAPDSAESSTSSDDGA